MDEIRNPFFIREDIRQGVQKRVDALKKGYRQNIALLGPSGMGKSSILSFLYTDLSRQQGIIPVYFHADFLSFENFVERWMGSILVGLFSSESNQPPRNLDSLIQAAELLVPKTAQTMRHIRRGIRKEKHGVLVRELFSLTGILAAETEKHVIFMVDEFQKLENLPVSDPFSVLGKDIMIGTKTLYLFSSSTETHAYEILHDKLSLLFGHFEIYHLGTLSFSEIIECLSWHLPGYQFSAEQLYFIIHLTDGHPRYIRFLVDSLKEQLSYYQLRDEKVSSDHKINVHDQHVLEAFHRELIPGAGRISLYFENHIEACRHMIKDSGSYIRTLIAISRGRRKLNAIAAYIEKRTEEVKKILQRLMKEEIVVKKGSFFFIEDILYRFWLREVFEEQYRDFEPHDARMRNHLQEVLQTEFERCKAIMKSAIPERLEALLDCFHNDAIEIENKKIRCPQFTDVHFRPSEVRGFPILAKGPKSRWLCQVAEFEVHEDDMLQFLDEAKRYRKKAPAKVMIALRGTRQNARLIAQEAKIQVWDLRLLNQLMDLYSQPKIILLESQGKAPLKLDSVSETLIPSS